jgi:hypothetical protein
VSETSSHLKRVRTQFTRQADASSRMAQTTDEASLSALVMLSGVEPSQLVLDVACGPCFLTMTFRTKRMPANGAAGSSVSAPLSRSVVLRQSTANFTIAARNARRSAGPFVATA